MIKIIKQLVPRKSSPVNSYLFSISMGVDSVAAFMWMKAKGYHVIPIHFNHGIREQNSLMNDKFYALCDMYHLKEKYSETNSSGYTPKTESEYRKLRLKFYQRAANWASAHFYFEEMPTIITAHHLNDYVENYLLNCFRGHPNYVPIEFCTKFIPLEENQDLFSSNYKIIHPFLLTRKRDFRQFLERNNYLRLVVEDETNIINKGSRRNWIRNKIIPEMTENKLCLEKFAKRKIEDRLKLESFLIN